MIPIEYGLLILMVIVIFIDLTLLLSFIFNFKSYGKSKVRTRPFVSILVAARNEEHNILNCLQSLSELAYPDDKYEVLIGNDGSQDNTLSLAQQFCKKHIQFSVFDIQNQLGNARGKANVLAHLAKEARGEYFFITDADCEVNSEWINGLLTAAGEKVGIVTGMTYVSDHLQNMDWLFALGMVKVIGDMGRPVTAMGNNMCISREAYETVGGYEIIPFSITEDFELFKHVKAKGYEAAQIMNHHALAKTKPASNIFQLLQQRKRWMHGAVKLSWFIVALLLLQALYHLATIGLLILNFETAVILVSIKIIIQSLFIILIAQKNRIKLNFGMLMPYEFYSTFLALATGLFYLIPVGVKWKGRKY